MIDFFSFVVIDFLVLAKVMVEIEVSALLLMQLIILLVSAPLGIMNRLPLKLSFFSSINCFSELGSFPFSHLQTNLDSWTANSSSSFKMLLFFSLVMVCCFLGLICLQDFVRILISGFSLD